MKYEIPEYWMGSTKDVKDTISAVKKGTVHTICKTPGGSDVYMVEYGEKNELYRTANYSSAMGGENFKYYADKSHKSYSGCVMLIGGEHGGEFEGTVALNNLIYNIETGRDYQGNENSELIESLKGLNLLIIPCLNMDGRNRIPLKAFIGEDFHSFRYYSQGTWKPYINKDGELIKDELCGHPGCKTVHPILEASDFLGGYFNDDGVNVMHDNFFMPMAEETKSLFRIIDSYVPDITLHLHGGGNCKQLCSLFDYIPGIVKKKIAEFNSLVAKNMNKQGLGELYLENEVKGWEDMESPPSFNLISACTALCGEPNIVYESNQSLDLEEGMWGWDIRFSPQDIYSSHKVLFKSAFEFAETLVCRRKEG